MKTAAEQKFDSMVKDVFHTILKPLGFKKKGNNFYVWNGEIGKIINLQKSAYYSKDNIEFTINTGLFSPVYWDAFFTYPNKVLPEYPTEPECVVRRRVGILINGKDTWYQINDDTDMIGLESIQKDILVNVILPYFNRVKSNQDIIGELDQRSSPHLITKLIMLGELGMVAEAKLEFERVLSEVRVPQTKEMILELGIKYQLN